MTEQDLQCQATMPRCNTCAWDPLHVSATTTLLLSQSVNRNYPPESIPTVVEESALTVMHSNSPGARRTSPNWTHCPNETLLRTFRPLAGERKPFLFLDQTHRIQQAHSLVTQLQEALDSRVVIEQAKGILAERHCTDFPSAFHKIRSIARREQRPLRTVAADIVAGLLQPS